MTLETLEADTSPFLSPRLIFVLVFISHFLDYLLIHLRKRTASNPEQIQLREGIKQLLREAKSLSTPSTFAQAAKLRRQAAAKEKELNKLQGGKLEEKKWFLFGRALFVSRVVLYLGLAWQFWGIPVIQIPNRFLQPFGRMLAMGAANDSKGLVPVGIIPWLALTSQVSRLFCKKLSSH